MSWVIISYLLTTTATILVCGRAWRSDRAHPPLQVGARHLRARFSALRPLARWAFLVAFRCLQGLGGTILYALPSAIVSRHLPAGPRGAAFGILTTAAALATVGSPLGGFITVHCGVELGVPGKRSRGRRAIFLAGRFLPKDEAPLAGWLDLLRDLRLSALGLASLTCADRLQEADRTAIRREAPPLALRHLGPSTGQLSLLGEVLS